MFFKYSILITSVLLTLAAATPTRRNDQPASQCNTGSLQCCDSTQSASSPSITTLLGLLGISASSISGLVGVTCSPISVIGVGGNSCTADPVCCENNSFNGVVALGCSPVDLGL